MQTAKRTAKTIKKDEVLSLWKDLTPQPINPKPVPYKHEGSTYGEDGIRITGSREFIESVLSRLTDLLAFEAMETRLAISYSEQVPRTKEGEKVVFGKDGTGQYACYVKVAERGDPAGLAAALAFNEWMRGDN